MSRFCCLHTEMAHSKVVMICALLCALVSFPARAQIVGEGEFKIRIPSTMDVKCNSGAHRIRCQLLYKRLIMTIGVKSVLVEDVYPGDILSMVSPSLFANYKMNPQMVRVISAHEEVLGDAHGEVIVVLVNGERLGEFRTNKHGYFEMNYKGEGVYTFMSYSSIYGIDLKKDIYFGAGGKR